MKIKMEVSNSEDLKRKLEEIRQRTLESVNLRKDRTGARVVVGMATCGIAAGARPILMAFLGRD